MIVDRILDRKDGEPYDAKDFYNYCMEEQRIEQYFDELHFTETQRKAYWAARREYMREANS